MCDVPESVTCQNQIRPSDGRTKFVIQKLGRYNFVKRFIADNPGAQQTIAGELCLAVVIGTVARFSDCECSHEEADCVIATSTLLRERPNCMLTCCSSSLFYPSQIHCPLLRNYWNSKVFSLLFTRCDSEKGILYIVPSVSLGVLLHFRIPRMQLCLEFSSNKRWTFTSLHSLISS